MLIMYLNKYVIACIALLKTLMILQQQFVQKHYINYLHLIDLTREVLQVHGSEIKYKFFHTNVNTHNIKHFPVQKTFFILIYLMTNNYEQEKLYTTII